MIRIKNITKSFGQNKVLDDVSFDINQGDIVAIIGPSGTGKSTLLRCINNLANADQGIVEFEGFKINLSNYKKRELLELRKRTSMVFQQFNLFSKKTAKKNVMEGLEIVKKIKHNEASEKADDMLKKVKMYERKDFYPRHLSGGQQQRVAIARALAMEPELLLLDEPTSALDPELVGEVLEIIQKIASEGNTMLLVSHEMEFVRKVATKVIFMDGGHIIESGTADEVFEQPKEEKTKEFLLKNKVDIQAEYII